MGKPDPVGKGGEQSGSIVGGWGGQLLWEGYMPWVSYGAKVEYEEAKIQCSWVDIKNEKLVSLVYCSAILFRKNLKNAYKDLTEMTMCFCNCTVAEWTWKWYC